MIRAHKIELDVNNKQTTHLVKGCGIARFAYNWGLDRWNTNYNNFTTAQSELLSGGKLTEASELKPNPMSQGILRKDLNRIKREKFPWMLEVTKYAIQGALIDLGEAFKRYFDGTSGHPTLKHKGQHDSFWVSNDHFSVDGYVVTLPKLGKVRLTEQLRFNGKILEATVSRTADKWFISIAVEVKDPTPIHDIEKIIATLHRKLRGKNLKTKGYANVVMDSIVGIDLGIKDFLVMSNGEFVANNKTLKLKLKELKKLQRSLSRKQGFRKGEAKSNSYKEAKIELAKLHKEIADKRNDIIQKITSILIKKYAVICLETLNVRGMMRNHRLARAIADCGFYEFKRVLKYKAQASGTIIIEASQWFASSKTCSHCGYKLDTLPLYIREWTCPHCKNKHNRDFNASVNLRNYGIKELLENTDKYIEVKVKTKKVTKPTVSRTGVACSRSVRPSSKTTAKTNIGISVDDRNLASSHCQNTDSQSKIPDGQI